jgi:K+-transporting ATPase A subunit
VTVAGWMQLAVFVAILTALTPPLGAYLTRVFAGERVLLTRVLGPVERGTLRTDNATFVGLVLAVVVIVVLLTFVPALLLGSGVQGLDGRLH